MVDDFALSCVTTATDTRIYTLVIVARFVQWTFCADSTFWPARWRATDISRQTRADGLVVYSAALAVGAARAWITRFYVQNCKKKQRSSYYFIAESTDCIILNNFMKSWLTNLRMYDIRRMHFLLFRQGKYILGYDYTHYIAQLGHMFLDMGLYIYFLSKLCLTDNPCLLNTLVYSRNMDLLGSH